MSATPTPTDPPSGPSLAAWLSWLRRFLAVAILTALVTSAAWAPRQECAESVVANESGKDATFLKTNVVVTTCKDASAASLYSVAGFALAVILLSPDFTEISFGGVTLKAKVREQERQIAKQGEKQEALERQLVDFQLRMSQSVTNNLNLGFLERGEAAKTAQELGGLSGISPRLASPTRASDAPPLSAVTEDTADTKVRRLLEIAEKLRTYDPTGKSSPAQLPPTLNSLFFQTVQRARNAVAHAQPITTEDLDAAIMLGERLLTPPATP